MHHAVLFYITNLLVYAGVDAIACLGLSMQFGVSGVVNFGFIIFQAAGAYTAAILSLPPDSANGGFQQYISGLQLPFPVPWIGAAVVGGVISIPFAALVGRRLRGDFAAVGLLVTAVILNTVVTNFRPFLNGAAGLALVPAPLNGQLDSQSQSYQWYYSAAAIIICIAVYVFLRRITESPYGRSLRAMRDNDIVADSLGKRLVSLRTAMLVTGGAVAGLSGGILVGFINLWAPSAWLYQESIVLFAAVIIGGMGNHRGAILGAILVPLGFEEATRFIPAVGGPNLIPALQWVVIGLLIVLFLWFRPQGILPERRRMVSRARLERFARPLPPAAVGASASRMALAGLVAGSRGPLAVPVDYEGGERAAVGSRESSPESAALAPAAHRRAGVDFAVLETRGLGRSFEGVRAVDDVSISVARSRLTGLIGPNGAGKSTLLSMLAGTLPASSGQVLYRGEDITGLPAFRRARQGLVRTFQLASEFKRLTVLENLLSAVPGQAGDSFLGAVRGKRYWARSEVEAIDRASALLNRFGLAAMADSYAGDLSGGQRRLVEIMRALMTQPEVLLLDEPMAGVHPRLAREIGAELVALCREGMTIVMVEHELAIMDEFCDPVIVMAEGKVLAEGTMAVLRGRSEVVEAYLVG
ncbi:MAG: ATP-binding cassette domain-containing protein [Acidimicrobiales bacterium]